MHSCMHMETHNWLKQEELSLFFSFVQSKLREYQLCVPNWEYRSEHDGAYHPAASQPITSIILTSLFLYVLWNRPGAKWRFSRMSWPTSKSQTRCLWGRNTGLARWELEEFCKQREEPECSDTGRYLLNRKPASVTATWEWRRGNAR